MIDLEFTHCAPCPRCGRLVAAGTEHECRPKLLAYEITFAGITAHYCAATRARARYLAALEIVDAGFARNIGDAMVAMRCIRAPEADIRALCRGREGSCPR